MTAEAGHRECWWWRPAPRAGRRADPVLPSGSPRGSPPPRDVLASLLHLGGVSSSARSFTRVAAEISIPYRSPALPGSARGAGASANSRVHSNHRAGFGRLIDVEPHTLAEDASACAVHRARRRPTTAGACRPAARPGGYGTKTPQRGHPRHVGAGTIIGVRGVTHYCRVVLHPHPRESRRNWESPIRGDFCVSPARVPLRGYHHPPTGVRFPPVCALVRLGLSTGAFGRLTVGSGTSHRTDWPHRSTRPSELDDPT